MSNNNYSDLQDRVGRLEAAISTLPELQRTLAEIDKKLARYEGRWGTLLTVGTALWAMFVVFKDDILALFHR